jgi:hypothetical protein
LLYNYASLLHRIILAIMDVHIDLEEKQLQTIEGSHVTALGKYCPYVEESLVSYWDNDMEAMQCIKWS